MRVPAADKRLIDAERGAGSGAGKRGAEFLAQCVAMHHGPVLRVVRASDDLEHHEHRATLLQHRADTTVEIGQASNSNTLLMPAARAKPAKLTRLAPGIGWPPFAS